MKSELIKELTKRQGRETNEAFAGKLGITSAMWGYLKAGRRNPGIKFYNAVIMKFPDLKDSVLKEMAGG